MPTTNLASVPIGEAMKRAFEAGFRNLANDAAVSSLLRNMSCDWLNENVPHACGQTGAEYDELMETLMTQFELGCDAFVSQVATRIDEMWQAVDADREVEAKHG